MKMPTGVYVCVHMHAYTETQSKGDGRTGRRFSRHVRVCEDTSEVALYLQVSKYLYMYLQVYRCIAGKDESSFLFTDGLRACTRL